MLGVKKSTTKKIMKIFYSTLVLIIILSSCGTSNSVTSNHFFQKRKYTSGWNLNHSTKVVSANEEFIKENKTIESSLNSTINLEESTSNLIELKSKKLEPCDTIILIDGNIVRAKILSTSDSTIQYTSCESDAPSEFTMNKKEVKAIQYADGKFEFIKHQSASDVHKNELKKKEITKLKRKEIKEENKKRKRTILIVILSILIVPILIYGILLFGVMVFGWGI